jgi:hypothetical protein
MALNSFLSQFHSIIQTETALFSGGSPTSVQSDYDLSYMAAGEAQSGHIQPAEHSF